MKRSVNTLVLVFLLCLLSSCESVLEEPVYSELAPDNLLNTEEGMTNVLYSAYAKLANMSSANSKTEIAFEEWPTDMMWQTGGGENGNALQLINYTLDANLALLYSNFWQPYYQAIRNTNILLDNIDRLNAPQARKDLFVAEARFIRACAYYRLYTAFGPVPLRKSETDPVEQPKATDEAMRSFIETELLASVASLPNPGQEEGYGRATKGAAYGFLCKFYLNTRQWQKSADMAKAVMDMGYYQLFASYVDLFKVNNERNKEFIFVKPAFPSADRAASNDWMNAAFPVGFVKDPVSGLTFQSNWVIFASEYRMRDQFYNSFDPNDKRRQLIITRFINAAGNTIQLLGNDNTRSFKYWPDPNAVQQAHGNDIPVIRYADILLSRAEALLETSGLKQESIDLINQVRTRAGLPNLTLASFTTPDQLRDHLLKERGWEFYSEGKRRRDMIRMGKLISNAQARGITNAKPHHVLFPIPQQAIDSNPSLKQNDGY